MLRLFSCLDVCSAETAVDSDNAVATVNVSEICDDSLNAKTYIIFC